MRKRPEARKLASEKTVWSCRMKNGVQKDIKDYTDEYNEYVSDFIEDAVNFMFASRIEYEDQKELHGDNIADTFELWLEDII